ncbi:kinase-like domain-containing protein [Suillus placidus]|uniref:non-specific serine/threonine protein kinase n=1 Tax=Suillus placidus TaxID=48579 RepID=A0A9P6ZZ51_9AGAM|nr:kinase-like domain-containing protein [Suillus placidus]
MELEMSFQTRRDICFAMELMANDLLYYMIRESAYCRANARRWSAQMALGINALHCMGIIHRDIKAENILIDIRENVRIADFGLCYTHKKPLDRQWRYSSDVTGTTQCMAPEMLHNKKNPRPTKYGITVDWWSFGCVLYELVSHNHQPLFATEKVIIDYVTWHRRLSNTVKLFPAFEGLDSSVAGLVAGLLRPLALVRYGFEDLMMHPWFENNDVSEFYDASNRALRRAEWPHMRPNLLKGQSKAAVILTPLSAWPSARQSKRFIDVDWTNPNRFGVVSSSTAPPSNLAINDS